MGNNCGSRNKEYDELLRPFDSSQFKDLFLEELNEPFKRASEILKELESFRKALIDVPLQLINDTDVRVSNEPRFLEVLRTFIWSVSACNAGKVEHSRLNFYNKAPFFTIHTDTLSTDVLCMYNSLKTYFDALAAAHSRIAALEDKLHDIVKKVFDQNKAAKKNEADFRLSSSQKELYFSNSDYNIDIVKKEMQHLERLLARAEEDENRYKASLLPKIKVEMLVANVFGGQANKENLKNPKEIFLRFHSGNKRLKSLNDVVPRSEWSTFKSRPEKV